MYTSLPWPGSAVRPSRPGPLRSEPVSVPLTTITRSPSLSTVEPGHRVALIGPAPVARGDLFHVIVRDGGPPAGGRRGPGRRRAAVPVDEGREPVLLPARIGARDGIAPLPDDERPGEQEHTRDHHQGGGDPQSPPERHRNPSNPLMIGGGPGLSTACREGDSPLERGAMAPDEAAGQTLRAYGLLHEQAPDAVVATLEEVRAGAAAHVVVAFADGDPEGTVGDVDALLPGGSLGVLVAPWRRRRRVRRALEAGALRCARSCSRCRRDAPGAADVGRPSPASGGAARRPRSSEDPGGAAASAPGRGGDRPSPADGLRRRSARARFATGYGSSGSWLLPILVV